MPLDLNSVNDSLSSRSSGSRGALAVVSIEARDTVPLAPSEFLGTAEHPFGRLYRSVDERDIEEIVAISDPVLRNLRITLGYHDLTRSMTFLLGQRNVSWCAFALWASRTAGHFIRGDYIPELIQACLDHLEASHRSLNLLRYAVPGMRAERLWPGAFLAACIRDVAGVVSSHLAHGNLIVFAEIAPLFARMHNEFRGATQRDEQAIARFLSKIKPGHVSEGGQDLLRCAFRSYYDAMFEDDRKRKAELMLLANDSIGLHEQTRLQHDIERSLNAPIAAIFLQAARERALAMTQGRLERAGARLTDRKLGDRVGRRIGRAVERALRPIADWLQQSWAQVATRWLMRMEIPGETLLLGRDVSNPTLLDMFPDELATIEDIELRALLYQLDRTPNTPLGSAASNWGDLGERMNFVVDFFRIYQQEQRLFKAPFGERQTELIRDGVIPEDGLL